MNKTEWIQKYGSKRLRILTKEGYENHNLYLKERVDKEYRGFKPYLFDWITPSATPSIKALKQKSKIEKKGYSCKIAWGKFKQWNPILGELPMKDKEIVVITDFHGVSIFKSM